MHLNTIDYKTVALPTNEQWTWSLFHELEKLFEKNRHPGNFFCSRELCLLEPEGMQASSWILDYRGTYNEELFHKMYK